MRTKRSGSHSFDDHKQALAKFRKTKKKEEGDDKKGKDGGKGKKGKGQDKFENLAEGDVYMDDAEFSAWLLGHPDEYTYEGMQCLIEREGTSSDQAPEIIGALTGVIPI